MGEKKITIELSTLLARCLQRMLVEEIENQEKWAYEEEQEFGAADHSTREKIINECDDLRTQLEEKGIAKHYKCH